MDPNALAPPLLLLRDILSILGVCFNVVRYLSPLKLLTDARNTSEKYQNQNLSRQQQSSFTENGAPTAVDTTTKLSSHQQHQQQQQDNNNHTISFGPSKAQFDATQQLSGMPYVCQNLCSSYWLTYGYMNNITSLIVINIFGIVMSAYYIYLYYMTTRDHKRAYIVRILLGQSLFLCGLLLFNYQLNVNHMDLDLALKWWGFAATCVTIVNFGSPLSTLRTVLRTRDSESIPLHLTIANLCGTLTWTMYGVLRFDRFIAIPNSIGAMLSILNLTVKYVYRKQQHQQQQMDLSLDE